MRPTVWKEARRANRDEGLGTSMPGRILGAGAFLALVWVTVNPTQARRFQQKGWIEPLRDGEPLRLTPEGRRARWTDNERRMRNRAHDEGADR